MQRARGPALTLRVTRRLAKPTPEHTRVARESHASTLPLRRRITVALPVSLARFHEKVRRAYPDLRNVPHERTESRSL